MAFEPDFIGASELGEFVYCKRSWHLARRGAPSGLLAERKRGVEFHQRHSEARPCAARAGCCCRRMGCGGRVPVACALANVGIPMIRLILLVLGVIALILWPKLRRHEATPVEGVVVYEAAGRMRVPAAKTKPVAIR
jgi:hypothetical protein